MSENILSLRKLRAKLLGEADQPRLGSAASAVKRSEVLFHHKFQSIYQKKALGVYLIVDVNTQDSIFSHPGSYVVRRRHRVVPRRGRRLRRSKGRDNEGDSSSVVLREVRAALACRQFLPILSLVDRTRGQQKSEGTKNRLVTPQTRYDKHMQNGKSLVDASVSERNVDVETCTSRLPRDRMQRATG